VKRAPFDPIERWYHEALWECYLPLLDMLWRHRREKLASSLTVSLSPPLLAMMDDVQLAGRFVEHMKALRTETEKAPLSPALMAHYIRRQEQALRVWKQVEARPALAFAKLAEEGRIELVTTAVSHALLPALNPVGGARAQLLLGRWALAQVGGGASPGMWLPECAVDETMCEHLASLGISHTVVDSHALVAASGRHRGVGYFARDEAIRRLVWGHGGYPSHRVYREFHDDLGLRQTLGPFQKGSFSGLKDRAIGSPEANSYAPAKAQDALAGDVADFVARLQARVSEGDVVAAFDAELFGHWWHEGVDFLDQTLRALADTSGWHACSLATCAHAMPACSTPPRASSWGMGGHQRSWVGPRSARYWRKIHRLHRAVCRSASRGHRHHVVAARALLPAMASDWLFMLEHNILAVAAETELQRLFQAVERALDEGCDDLDGLWQGLDSDTVCLAFASA
jgi:1,4-alpha-glucan branching enzyme